MNYDLIELAKRCPDLAITVRLSDLVEANRGLIEETKRELVQSLEASKPETYLTRERLWKCRRCLRQHCGDGKNAAISSLYPSAAKGATVILTSLKSLNDETEEPQPVLYGVSVILD